MIKKEILFISKYFKFISLSLLKPSPNFEIILFFIILLIFEKQQIWKMSYLIFMI